MPPPVPCHHPCSFLNDIPIAGAMITGILPGLALKIFLAIVPIILAIMNKASAGGGWLAVGCASLPWTACLGGWLRVVARCMGRPGVARPRSS